jgi:hypothetical protein
LLTHPDNGRFQRTMANRLWQRLMGRGVVHPVDAMQTAPWNQDLLDVLANQLRESGYDLRAALAFIATSEAYQARAEVLAPTADEQAYAYRGPRSKRLTAEQFVDAVWRLTGTTPAKIDAGVTRAPAGGAPAAFLAQPIWSNDTGRGRQPAVGEARAFRQSLTLAAAPRRAACTITGDTAFELWVNGRKVGKMWLPGVFIFIFLMFTCMPVAVLLLPVALLVFIPGPRNTIAAWRTPKVMVTVPRRVAPGQPVPTVIELDRFGPPVKAVSATLLCVERAISGSGKHQRTTEHTLYEEALVLKSNVKQTRFEGEGVMPDLPLWSFEGGSYSVTWMLLVRLECSAWPDWITAWPLSVDPAGAPALAAPPRAKIVEKIAAPVAEPIAEPPAAPVFEAIVPAPVAAPPPAGDEAKLAALSRGLKTASPLNEERATLLREASATPLTFTVLAERVERSFGLHLPEGHRDGRTATGALADGTPVSVSLSDADTAAAEGKPRGTPLRVTATVTGWNTLYDRVELVGALV